MKIFTFKDITVGLYTDPEEFTKELFDIPEDAILDLESIPNSAGLSEISENKIWININKLATFEDILIVSAHELGHLITGGFSENPSTDEEFDDLHEVKAEHYENFVMDSYDLAKTIEEILYKN